MAVPDLITEQDGASTGRPCTPTLLHQFSRQRAPCQASAEHWASLDSAPPRLTLQGILAFRRVLKITISKSLRQIPTPPAAVQVQLLPASNAAFLSVKLTWVPLLGPYERLL